MLKLVLLKLLAVFFCMAPALAQEQVAIVRKGGLLVFLPGIGGPDTYGTYFVPDALGRDSLDRFQYLGNPLQINFLPPSELPSDFPRMNAAEKLEEFFRTESRHMTKAFGKQIEFTNFENIRCDGADGLSATTVLDDSGPEKMELRLTARVAGEGILHAAYQNLNPETTAETQSMAEKLLSSFKFVPRPLTPDELAAISQKARQ